MDAAPAAAACAPGQASGAGAGEPRRRAPSPRWLGALGAVGALGAALLARQGRPGAEPAPAPAHARDACGAAPAAVAAYGLPDVVATNWGQANKSYAYPPERLALCADGRGFLWTSGAGLAGAPAGQPRWLDPEEVRALFSTLLKVWPQGRGARGVEDGNFIWILDADYHLVVAPTMQRREPGAGLVEVKHGDLCPGLDFTGRNGAAGSYRGVARAGGEFNLAGARDGAEWVLHTKSAYTASRVPLEDAQEFYRVNHELGRSEAEIAGNFEACVRQACTPGRGPFVRLLCYLREHLKVRAVAGDARTCDILNKLVLVPGHGALPNLTECELAVPGWAPACVGRGAPTPGGAAWPAPAVVHLVDWVFPGQTDPCARTTADFDASFGEIGGRMARLADASTGHDEPRRLRKKTRFLRKHSCFETPAFAEQLRCNLHGCFGEGFTTSLQAVEDLLAYGPPAAREAQAAWGRSMRLWQQCLHGGQSGPA